MNLKSLTFCLLFILSYYNADAVKITFSETRGYYSSSVGLTLSTDNPAASIRYTTNLDTPSPSNGTWYNPGDVININSTTIVKAFAWDAVDSTKVHSHSYIFLSDIISSTYMSNHIVGAAQYSNQLEPAFLELPAISLTSNAYAANSNIDIDVATAVEMWYPDNESAFNENCGIQTWGGSPSNPKKSYRLEFKSEYGPKKLKYPVFDNDGNDYNIAPDDVFNSLLLRAGSQDGLNGEFCDENLAQFIRNRFIFDRWLDLGYPAPHGRYVHVFINGDYEGQYHLQERPDEHFFESYYGEPDSLYEVRKSGTYWNQPLASPFFDNLATQYNNPNYLDQKQTGHYVVLHDFIANFDWGYSHNNLGGAFPVAGEGGYKFMPWDIDLIMGNHGVFTASYTPMVSYNSVSRRGPIEAGFYSDSNGKLEIADAMECMCYNDGPFTAPRLAEEYQLLADKVELSLVAEAARWGNVNALLAQDIIQISNWDPQDEWVTERDRVLNTFIPGRLNYLEGFYQAAGLTPAANPAQFSQYGGIVPSGYSLILSGSGTIYYTTDGTDPRSSGGGLSASALTYVSPITITSPTVIMARVWANGTWSAMCPRTFYPDQSYSDLVINEIHYNPLDSIMPNDTIDGDSFEFIEFKNNGNDTYFLSGLRMKEGVDYKFPFGATVSPGDFYVIAEDSLLFIARYGFSPDGQYKGKLKNSGETLSVIDPLENLIDIVTYNDALPWDTIPDGDGPSLGLRDANLANNTYTAWGAQYVDYTPNEENRFCIPMTRSLTQADQLCAGVSDGTASISFLGGTPPVSHFWSNGSIGAAQSNLAPGTYIITTVDGTNCSYSDTITIAPIASMALTAAVDDPLCFGIDDGKIAVNVTGGAGSYSYLWSDGQNTSNADNLAPGNYFVTISDANSCQITENFTIANTPLDITINHTKTNPLCFGIDDGTISTTVSGGTGPYIYSWSSGQNTANISNLSAGVYFLTVEDVYGCTKTKSIALLAPPTALAIASSLTQPLCDGVDDGVINTAVTGGNGPYLYTWSDGQSTSTATNLAPGNYSLSVEDANGCVLTDSYTIQPPTGFLTITGVVVEETTFGLLDGSITLTTTGPSVTSYSWSNGASTQNLNNIGAGTHTVTITDSDGCTTAETYTLLVGPMIPVAAFTFSQNFIPAPAVVDMDASSSTDGDGNIVDYDWDFGNGISFASPNPLVTQNFPVAGSYNVRLIVTDDQGLKDTTYQVLEVLEPCVSPTTINQISATGTGMIVSWPSDPNVLSYTLEYRELGAGNVWTSVSLATPLAILTGLTACTDYEMRVTSECSYGYVSAPSTISVYNSGDCFVCTAPLNLYQFNVQNISAIITWDVLVGATSYTYKFRKVGDLTWITETTPFPIAVLFGISGCSDYEWTMETTCYDGSTAQSPAINNFSTLCKNEDESALEIVDSKLNVYPNPSSSFITIDGEESSISEMQIRNMNGQLIMSNNQVELPHIIDVSHWNSGIYYLNTGGQTSLFVVE